VEHPTGFQADSVSKAEDYARHLLDLYGQRLAAGAGEEVAQVLVVSMRNVKIVVEQHCYDTASIRLVIVQGDTARLGNIFQ
jgi:hypothetical protein